MHPPRSRARTSLPHTRSVPASRPARVLALGQAVFLAAVPGGGQRLSRRNAWSGMSADAVRSRARREADDALDAAGYRSPQPVRPVRAPVRVARSG